MVRHVASARPEGFDTSGTGSSVEPGDFAVAFHRSIGEIPQLEWDGLLPGIPDALGYYRAIEEAPPPHFRLGAVTARSRGDLAAAAPVFKLDYPLDTSLHGGLRHLAHWLHVRWPWLTRVIAIGSPVLDSCTLGFAKHLNSTARRNIFAALLETIEGEAQRDACAIIVVKSLDDEQADMLHSTLMERGYRRITCLPTVILDTRYRAFEDYMASLSHKRRKNFREKLRSLKHVRFEFRSSLKGLETELHGLFDNTRMQPRQHHYNEFEELHPDYFRKVKQHLGDRLQVLLGWEGDELMSMITLLVGSECINARDFGMKYPRGRELNLYFLSLLKTIEYAIERRMSALDMGVSLYPTKLQFGGRLERKWLYLRFRRALSNRIFGPLVPLFDFERNEPELQALLKKRPKLGWSADESN
jgi:hypothetical protein